MRSWHLIPVIVVAIAVASCSDPLRSEGCTLVLIPGISVRVVDSLTFTPVTTGLSGTLVEEDYVEAMFASEHTLTGARDRPGRYTVVVSADGYQTWTRSGVRVLRDGCHVTTVELRARLLMR